MRGQEVTSNDSRRLPYDRPGTDSRTALRAPGLDRRLRRGGRAGDPGGAARHRGRQLESPPRPASGSTGRRSSRDEAGLAGTAGCLRPDSPPGDLDSRHSRASLCASVARSNPPHGRGSGDGTPPSPAPRHDGLAEAIATLGAMLESASTIANDLAAGGLFDRLQQVFTRMPAEDREAILRVLEREVELRCFSRGTGDTATGYETRPNPNARLYLRVLTDQEPPQVLDRDELVVAQ